MGGLGDRGESMGGAVVSLDTGKVVGFLAEPRREKPASIQSPGISSGGMQKSFSISIAPSTPQILPAIHGSSFDPPPPRPEYQSRGSWPKSP